MDNYQDVIGGTYLSPSQRVLAELKRLEKTNRRGCLNAVLVDSEWTKETEAKLASRLEQARIELLLAAGPAEVCRIYEAVPPGLELLLLGPKPRTIEQAARCVVLNLDWYLDEPKPLFRWEWVRQLAAVLLLAYITLSWLLMISGAIFFSPGIAIQTLLIGIVVWVANSGDNMRHSWIRVLRQYLESVYFEQRLNQPGQGLPVVPSALAKPETRNAPLPDEPGTPDPWNNPRQ